MDIGRIASEAGAMLPQLIAWRRDFHMYPELGFQEQRTAGIVSEHLQRLGLEVAAGVGGTGVVALVEGRAEGAEQGPTVLLRFDMDALPIEERNSAPYRSRSAGVMHACGHDGHTAIGMAVAELLATHVDSVCGRVKLVFQPAEEALGGAKAMIADGVLDDPAPDGCFAMHLWSRLPLNQVVAQPGPLWASASMFSLEIEGLGGHGAAPHETIDATVVACHIVIAWQTIVSRTLNPTDTAVITVGQVSSGSAMNAVSGRASLSGTVRAFSPEVEATIMRRMREIADGICRAFGATWTLSFPYSAPVTVNSEAGAGLMRRVAGEIVGAENVTEIKPMMVSEDMAEFLNRVPGCYVLLGASDPHGPLHSPHHNPTFDFDERVLSTGAALMTAAAIRFLDEYEERQIPAETDTHLEEARNG